MLWVDMRKDGMSYRQIAEADKTASKDTIQRAIENSTVSNETVEFPKMVVGKDGKQRQATQREPKLLAPWQVAEIADAEECQASPPETAIDDDDVCDDYNEDDYEYDDESQEPSLLDEQGPEKRPHVANNGGNNEWYTPEPFITAARLVMGGIDLDPASSEIANRTVKAARIFTAADDGLIQDWPIGRIWMNPPYAQPLMGRFATRFAAEIRRGSEGVVLVNNATETGWFQEIAEECSAICFPKTRIRFLDPEGNPGAPLQGQAIIYCGPNSDAFQDVFEGFGLVVRHG
jgi:phage N-6-adenine-methyltransferase